MKDMPSQQKKPQQMRVASLENAIRESEMHYRRMFEAAEDGILIVNTATGKVDDANPYLLNLLGFTREDVLKKKVWQLYVDAKAAKQAFETLQKKEYIRMGDLPMQSRDGRLVPVESVSNVYRVGKRNVIQFNIRDISEQKVREESLRENEMRLESLFDNSPIPIWEEDFSDVKNYLKKIKLAGKLDDAIRRYIARHPDLIDECVARVRIIDVNRACLALHNATDKSALLQGLKALVTEKSREALQEQIVAIAGGRTQLEKDSMVRTLDGQLRHVHVHWSVVPGHEDSLARVLVSTEDISQRIEAEEAQKVSERRFRSLIENSQDAIALLDATGKLIYESPSGLRITGYSAEERIGGTGFDLIHHDDLGIVRQHFGWVMQNPEADVRLQVRSRRKDGEWRWLDVTAVNLLADPAVGAIVVNYRDITERKQAEVALVEAEQTQNLLLESVGEGIHGLDAEGRIMFENAASLHMFRWEADEMLGQEAHALIHHHRVDGSLYSTEECPIYRTLRDGETRHIENEVFFRNDGSSFPVEYTCAAMKDKDGTITGVVVSFRDITERKQAEENIQQEQVFSDAIINSMPGIFYLFDTQGRFLRWNENFETVSGYSATDIAGMHPMDFFEGAEKELVRQRIKQTFETGHSFAEANFTSRDGSRAPYYFTGVRVELNGQICLLGVGVDITERKRAEKMLTNLSWAVNASGDIVFMTDKDGTIMSVNSQFTDLYGYAPEEVIGKTTPRILKSGKQGPEVYERFWQAITRGEMFRGQVVNKAKDGRLIPIEETVSPFFDERGEIAGFLAIQRNITDRRQAEESLRLVEAKYRILVENIPAIVYMDKADETSANLYTSPQIEKILGYTPTMFVENPTLWHQHIDPQDYPAVLASIRKTLEEGFASQEYRFIAWDGRTVWVRDLAVLIRAEDGEPQFIQGFIEDITAQKKAEEKIKAHAADLEKEIAARKQVEVLLEMALTQSPSGILIASAPDVTIQVANPAALNIRGGDQKLLTGIEVSQHVARWQTYQPDGSPYPSEQLPLSRAVLNGEVTRDEEAIIRDENGTDHWVSVNAAPIRDTDGRITAGIVIFHDISERKRAEQALVKSERDYRYLFNNAGDAILIFEPQDEIILQANATACRLYGFEYREIIGRSLQSLTKNIGRGDAYLNAFVRGEAPNIFESTHINKSGGEIDVLINSSLIEYEGNTAVLALVRDVTDRKRAEESLQKSEARLGEAQRIAHLGNWEWDIPVNSIWWSDETYRIFDLNPQEFEATMDGFLKTVHPDDRTRVADAISRALKGETPYDIDHRILLPDGTEKFLHEQAVVERDGSGVPTRMLGISHDITERKQAEENIRKQVSRLKALREIDMAIGAVFDMRLNLNTLLKHATAELNVDAASILLLNPNLNQLEYAAGYGFRTRAIEKSRLRPNEGLAGRVVMRHDMVRLDRLDERPEQFPRAALLAGERFVCYFGVPLVAKGIVKGVLEVFHRSHLDPDQDWLDFLHTLAGQAAIAVQDAELFTNLQQSNFELLHAYDATIEGWSRALDLRDKETEGHTQRVTEMAIRLAQKFGLSDQDLKYVRWGGLLHDIGKMGVPDNILLKAGALTDEEKQIVQQHPVFAYKMLSPIRYLKSAAIDIPYCHHEKWDGTGYPRGLKGEQIPLSARIFAVADVYDAVTSDRPYRGKWEKAKAVSYIREQAGIYFDPQVVEMFLNMVEIDLL